VRVARHDTALTATIRSRRALRYRTVAHPSIDRPAHVRAGSSLTWVGARLGIVQDDANFVALVDPRTALARSIALPAGEEGRRQFHDALGNKKFKLDLESCCTVEGASGAMLLALGSGSKKRRRRIVTIESITARFPRVSVIDAGSLYEALEAATEFAGSDLNIEGALALPGALRLYSRGNGTSKRGRDPVNASCELDLPALLAYLSDPAHAPVPTPRAIAQYDLGLLAGLPLGFTDAAIAGETLLYTAAAEASPDAATDGAVTGSVIGLIPRQGDLRYAPLTDVHGRPTSDKVEGLVPVPGATDRVLVVVDADDPLRASELCEVQLSGPWDRA